MTKRAPGRPVAADAAKTKTLPEAMRDAHLDEPDLVTSLRVFGTAVEFPLAREARTFTLGSDPSRDIALPGRYLSSLHCVLDRRAECLKVTDQASHNGTFFEGRRVQSFEIRPSDLFTAGPFTFLAQNDEMRAAYPTLVGLLGPEDDASPSASPWGEDASPSSLIVLAMGGRHMLLTGQAGCGQAQLARTIHDISLLRGRPPVVLQKLPADRERQREILDAASRSTLIITIDPSAPVMDAAFVQSAFSPSYRIRVIAIAPGVDKANQVLAAEHVRTMRIIAVPPLAFRQRAIPTLMDHALAARSASFRFSDLTAANQAALSAHGWPGNFDDLHLAATRLVAVATAASLRRAADALDLSYSTLQHWFSHLGLSQPVLAARET